MPWIGQALHAAEALQLKEKGADAGRKAQQAGLAQIRFDGCRRVLTLPPSNSDV
jgi:hypothetical protein